MGFAEIPPLATVIQEVAGSSWKYAPQYFMPAISGIVNTSQHRFVKTAACLELGLSAVSDEGLGRLYRLPILDGGRSVNHNMGRHVGKFNTDSVFCLGFPVDILVFIDSALPFILPQMMILIGEWFGWGKRVKHLEFPKFFRIANYLSNPYLL
ncbi:hypothetical protein HZC34_05645 [Candidatus Saganbacteria bacterium]|nr:hypothetical protein [Candidatus Saganbacteria bacterium]